jgi:hypothetical protein
MLPDRVVEFDGVAELIEAGRGYFDDRGITNAGEINALIGRLERENRWLNETRLLDGLA